MSAIWLVIKEFITSKKFVAAAAGVIVVLAARYGLNLDPATTQYIVGIIIAYLVGQGIADAGVEAAKVQGMVTLATTEGMTPKNISQDVKDKLI